MSQIIIDTGNVADDGTGSTLRQAFSDVNTMFTQVYASGPVDSNVRIANNQIVTTVINQDLIIAPSGIGNLQANARVVPGVDDVYDLGSPTSRWNTLWVNRTDVLCSTVSSPSYSASLMSPSVFFECGVNISKCA